MVNFKMLSKEIWLNDCNVRNAKYLVQKCLKTSN